PDAGATAAPGGDGDGGTGYDSLPQTQNAKNSLVVGSVGDVTADPYTSTMIATAIYSSYGPADDGRIKPDVVGNGENLYSSNAVSNASYEFSSGTSMAAPNVTGTVALIAEHYENTFGALPAAATSKGLAIHTASDAGNVGPDYAYGWGLVNAGDAATFITSAAAGVGGDTLIEGDFTGTELTYKFVSTTGGPAKATIVWTDPAGATQADGLDVRNPVLVHDLDLTITDESGTTFYAWTLDPNNPTAPAVRTVRNRVDNVEQVALDRPALGIYTIHVSTSGPISSQPFSLLVSGLDAAGGGGVKPSPPPRVIPQIGPQLIAARPNDGDLLLSRAANDPLDVAPRELQLMFRGGAGIDGSQSNLSQGIRVTRQGSDGAFDYAYAKTDFNTGGAVVVKFEAVRLGEAEEGISIQFTKSDHGTGSREPRIQVAGKTIAVDLNSQAGAETTAGVLADALNAHAAASGKIHASVTGNTALPLTTNLARAASVVSDFNTVTNPATGGTAELEFTAVTPGTAGNAIQIVVTKSDHANQDMAPTVSVTGTAITIDLNEETGYHTRAQQVADAINQHSVAKTLVRARVKSGSLLADVAAPDINYSPLQLAAGDNGNGHPVPLAPLVLSGAGLAEAAASFGVPGLEVLLRAAAPGTAGDGIQLTVLAANLGLNQAPRVTVTGRKITVTLNSNTQTPRVTALDLVNAVNASLAASALVRASIPLGNPAAVISAAAPATLETAGADDVIVPGYLGLGDSSSEVLVRFAETLPDDVYRLEVFGKDYVNLGIHALRNTSGAALTPQRSGDDRDVIDFELNLAPQIVSVVPQPVTRRIQVRLTNLPGDGDFRLIFQGERTAGLNVYDVTAQKIQSALEALPSIEPGEVLVSGPNLGPWEISFLGRHVNLPLADLRSDEAVVDIRYLSKLTQAEDQVLVYFNNDDLLASSAQNREFYRLIATAGTGNVADDLILMPHSVAYYADRDLAVLRFDDDSNLLTPYRLPHGTYRLEIGESEETNDVMAEATLVGTLFDAAAYQKVATLAGGDADIYRVDLPAASDLHVTVTPDAELTARGYLDTRVLVMDSSGAPLASSNEVQRLSYGGSPTVGTTFTLSFGTIAPTTTVSLAYNALAADIQTALEALGEIDPGDVSVTGGPLNAAPVDIEFTGGLAGASVAKLLITDSTNGRLQVQETDRLNVSGAPAGAYFVQVSSAAGAGSYLLQMGATAALTVDDANSSFATATDLGVLGEAGQSVASQIEPQSILLPQYPGSDDEPGHRQIQAEQHISFPDPGGYDLGIAPVAPGAITIRAYNFQNVIGEFPAGSGNLLYNLITEEEKQLARECFEILGSRLGIQFVETPNLGTTIAKGDLRAADPTIANGPGGVAGLGSPQLVVIDAQEGWTSSKFGGDFFETLFHEIGHAIGLGHAYDLPALMGEGLPNDVFPGDNDIVNAQRLWRPDANDIDLYRFEVTSPGILQAETVAERAASYSFLNTVLTLFGRDGEILARNDDYFSNDSFLQLNLSPGIYYVGVTSRGNTQYDPSVPDTGFGGLTDGPYQLKLGFVLDERTALVDATGVKLDGNHDGHAGGVFEFWFQTSDDVILVDKARDTLPATAEGTGTPADPYDSIATALADAGARIVTPARGSAVIRDGDSFVVNIGATPKTFEFDVLGNGVTAGRTAVPVPATEVQRLSFTGVPTSGTFTLSFGSLTPSTTVALPYNADAFSVRSALEALGDIGAGEIRVTGGPLPAAPLNVEFTGRYAGTHAALMTAVDRTNNGAGAGLRVTQTQSLAVSIRDAINSLVPPASSIAALTPSATAVKLTGVPRVDVAGSPGLLTGSNVVRVVGNAGTDNDADTAGDNRPYLVGTSNTNAVLPDGDGLIVPQGVTLMIDEGALLKLRKANIDAG
ncbi:MAG: S8 family serine peptidase, partial [Pirellulaceae bacterium]|nr:S8 family serine peptidase [Pirellulaceae bacterium]